MKRLFYFAIMAVASVVLLCLGAGYALAGLSISPGIIQVDEPLSPGSYYKLPSLQVTNTGNTASHYEVGLANIAEQEELQPTEDFLTFSPSSFFLEAGASQLIEVNLNVPAWADAGDYLAYLAAQPVASAEGGTSVGVAVATKLYFTVKPGNIVVGLAYSIAGFFTRTAPASYVVLGIIVLGVIIFLLRRYVRLEIRAGRK